jgi:hypothetical protein
MKIEWTRHALDRCEERDVSKELVEKTINAEHGLREENGEGEGDWRLPLLARDGSKRKAVYDNPVDEDDDVVVVVTILGEDRLDRLRSRRR